MTLSRNDTALLKGIAILMIVMHNFCHWLPGCVAENEYTFDAGRIQTYMDYIMQGGPHLVLNFFSHYGHYGVPLFLFLSGYGLVKKYESLTPRPQASPPALPEREGAPATGGGRTFKNTALGFIWGHAVKLWWLMLPAIALYWFCQQTMRKEWTVQATDLLAMVTYTANLFYVRDLILGPWWFFSLILQLYIVYRLALYPTRERWWVLWAVVLGCFMLQGWLYYGNVRMTPDWTFYLNDTTPKHWDLFNYCRYNFPTSMLPFGIGIAMARREKGGTAQTSVRALALTMEAGAVLLLASAFNSALWLVSPVFLLMALVPLATFIRTGALRSVLEWVGKVSAALFAVHPIVRAFSIGYAKQAEWHGEWTETYLVLACYLGISLVAAWAFDWTIKKVSAYVG